MIRFVKPMVWTQPWLFVAIPMLFGDIIIKHRKHMLYSERNGSGKRFGIFVGPLRVSWVKYR